MIRVILQEVDSLNNALFAKTARRSHVDVRAREYRWAMANARKGELD